ncbi:MAG: PspC domain-containing protein [Methanomicrobiales archaeon]|nr:PspC domain-containing protein [Methanomicrobiales archaeon]
MVVKKLLRPSKGRTFAGVCAGIGEYAGTDPTVIRLIYIIGSLFLLIWKPLSFLFSPPAYLVAWFVIPGEEEKGGAGETMAEERQPGQ